ncbi:replication-associated recombination protein A [Candidatus Fermentibacteria bacterium]|nr:MAG: replication-associated recombination protein A [Candidatus Fermentibacteria bacterium]
MDLLENIEIKEPKPPLADLLRPRKLEEVAGQDHLLSKDAAFRMALTEGVLGSFLLWGPPGSGKTTLILLVSEYTEQNFVRFSAVTGGVKQVRAIVADASRLRRNGMKTLLFVDEIHRFNKAQQDAFLPHVENGTITLAGATTENPSFEIIAPLLSRCTVYVLKSLEESHIISILERAAAHTAFKEVNPGGIADGVLEMIALAADGDGRRALNLLELLAGMASGEAVTVELTEKAILSSPLRYDKSGEEHYNLISALHKSLRSGDVDASLYWLARMMTSGENPLYIARRMIRFATEDIGLADPSALTVAMRATDSWRFLGSPEGDLALAEAACYLALAPKSNSVYTAWKRAVSSAQRGGSLPVPLHLRNAPTKLMKRLDYGRDYQYAHSQPGGIVTHRNFPDGVEEEEYYVPSDSGRESAIAEKLAEWKRVRERARKE